MDANERLHTEWLGMAQPEGLLVTASALKSAEANITWPVTELQAALRELAGEKKTIADLRGLLRDILEWSDDFLVARPDLPPTLRVSLEGGELLAPTVALRSADEPETFVFLVEETHRTNFDAASDDKRWTATPHQRFERLLRDTGVHVGLLTNGRDFRLVYAPKGESAGWVTFRLAEMLSVDGRPLLGAFHMLLNERRLLSLEDKKRLRGLLEASREYQNTVSNKLREQILGALRDLLTGFQHADRIANGAVLRDYRGARPEMYTGLVTVLMRMVFVLYAEERGLLPMESELYASGYSLSRLYAQLQDDRNRHGDTMEDRFGAWGRVITLFRLLHDGVRAADGLFIPARKGSFFDPDAFPFLEGRPRGAARQAGEVLELPRLSDGVVYRVLDRLLMLDGERLQYKGLDVEQIGSVYEGLMGFEVEVAEGDSLCVMPEHVVVNLEALLRLSGAERLKELKSQAGLDLKDKAAGEVKAAASVEALGAALAKRMSSRQPGLIARGSLYLQPGEERRKTGSHYTPRSLTQPIVETTLRPVLERLGPGVTPEQILDLKICDPAMGSGAFLVEACRQLADKLVEAWRRTGAMPELPPDEDPALHARRLIAQRCIYGVDKNPLAVDLARLSMWLVTFAKDHPFTFVNHSLRHGDSLVGLSKEQIFNLSLNPDKGAKPPPQARNQLQNAVRRAEDLRREIHMIGDPPDNAQLDALWNEANEALSTVRMLGDLVVASFFRESSDKARKKALEEVWEKALAWLQTGVYAAELQGMVAELREGEKPVPAFHWEVEFPEVFGRATRGFDCIAGNPPFLGGTKISERIGRSYLAFLVSTTSAATGNLDLAAYFLRHMSTMLSVGGALGIITTNSVLSGDSYKFGLHRLQADGGIRLILEPRARQWPGDEANVAFVEIFCVQGPKLIERAAVAAAPPAVLASREGICCRGCDVMGDGFVLSPEDKSLWEVQHRESLPVIEPFLGGSEFNTSPTLTPTRFIINFREMSEAEARAYPAAYERAFRLVRPARASVQQRDRRELWWLFATRAPRVYAYLKEHGRCLAISQLSKHLAFGFVPSGAVIAHTLVLFLIAEYCGFAVLQSTIHVSWAQRWGSSMRTDTRYTSAACFETFPFPPSYEQNPTLEAIGKEYYDFRAALMIKNNEGLTKTYNRFHNPEERSPDILKLRELHAAMDRAVLDAYGWTDIKPEYDFREQLDESIRYTWGEDTRDEVLARLLELNRVMAAKEAEEAAKAQGAKPAKKAAGKKRGKKDEATLSLLPIGDKTEDT